jgi:hypothetical protein
MVLLGAARGTGGVILLVAGAASIETDAPPGAVLVLGGLLLVIGILEIVAAIGVIRLNRSLWLLGIVTTLLFVAGGLVNGWLLFGRPGLGGTMLNAILAAVIIGCLAAGRDAVHRSPADG